MPWNFDDISFLLHNLPMALHDLMLHEDKELVEKNLPLLPIIKPIVSPLISIEKSIDPLVQLSAQNIGLLLNNYLQQLPSFDMSSAEGEALLNHWKHILSQQPQRLEVAKKSHWHDENSKSFWHDKIASYHTDFGITVDSFPDAWDDWQRASGVGHNTGNVKQLSAMRQKQWQDLVIRTRLHKETTLGSSYNIGV